GLRLRDAMPLANKVGGVVVGKFGTATVSYQELFA
ncbi:MAG: D-glycero-beta-D-manno-heptose-7-phosphate kinase, partial [Undibacterium sp.]